jgi:hypothetical protein
MQHRYIASTRNAAEFLTSAGRNGRPLTKRGLDKAHQEGRGPPYKIEGGTRVYTEAGLLAWVEKTGGKT